MALESAADHALSRPYPFDALGAQTQGMIGYWIAQAFSRTVPGRPAACLLCRTLVRADDPAMSHPAKFVGPLYDEPMAGRLAAANGWDMTAAACTPIRRATVDELRSMPFPAGSMAPKVEAACRFAESCGGITAIGRLDDAMALLDGAAGTTVTREVC